MNINEEKTIAVIFALKGSTLGTYTDLITIYDNGEQIATIGPTNNYGTSTYKYNATTPGLHLLTFSYAGNATHAPTSSIIQINVIGQKVTEIRIQVEKSNIMNLSEERYIFGNFALYGSVTGTYVDLITIYDNNEQIATIGPTNEYGTLAYKYKATTLGDHNITFKYAGNDTYLPCESTVMITVTEPPKETEILLEVEDPIIMSISEDKMITGYFKLKESTTGTYADLITIYDNNEQIATIGPTDEFGTINYKYTAATYGQHILTFSYAGNETHLATKTTAIITVAEPKKPTLKVDTTEFTQGMNATITARIYYENEYEQEVADINQGKVVFKVNGKTLKDSTGKVIYVKVVNGVASIEDYLIPDNWNNETFIQATYSGSSEIEKLESEKVALTIKPKELTLTATATNTTPGQTTTLTASLSDNTINTGKIVFKINGKTVKDENGKVIYAKVLNGIVTLDYVIPESYKAGNYTVTATFVASGYDKLEAETTMTVV